MFKQIFKNIYFLLLLLLSILYYFLVIFWGLDFRDGFYHINLAAAGAPYHFMTAFSSWILNILLFFTGKNILLLRFINALLIFSPFLILNYRFFKIKNHTLIFSLVLIILASLNLNVLGYDTITYSVLILLVATVLFIKTWNVRNFIILLLLTSLLVLIRFPNILLLGPLALIIFSFENDKKRTLSSFFFIFIALTLIFISYWLFSSQLIFEKADPNSHSYLQLLLRYKTDSFKVLSFFGLFFTGFYFFKSTYSDNKKMLSYTIVILVLIVSGIYSLNTPVSINFHLLLIGFILAMGAAKLLDNGVRINKGDNVKILVLLMMFLVPSMGSNTGLWKSGGIILIFPVFYYLFSIKHRKYWLTLLIGITLFSVNERIVYWYEDSHFNNLNTSLEFKSLKPIFTTHHKEVFLNELDSLVNEFKSNGYEVHFFGNTSHISQYLYSGAMVKEFHQDITPESIKSIVEIFFQKEGENILIINDWYPGEHSDKSINILQAELEEYDLKLFIKGDFLYIK